MLLTAQCESKAMPKQGAVHSCVLHDSYTSWSNFESPTHGPMASTFDGHNSSHTWSRFQNVRLLLWAVISVPESEQLEMLA